VIERFAPVSLAVLLAACGAAPHQKLAVAKVDTLPGGIVSVTSPGPTAWSDTASAWRLVPAGTIGGESGTPGELIDPQSLAVDDAGRVYVADDKPVVIKVFAPDGRFLHTIGREGEGPGEFKATFIAVHGSNLVVHDPRVSRTSVFDTSGAFLRSWTSSCCYYGPIGVDSAGRISVMTMATPEQKRVVNFVRYTLAGALVDTVIVPQHGDPKYWTVKQGRNSMMSTGIPASPRVVSALDPFGGVLYGFSDEYRIAASTTGRDTARLFGRAWTPEPVSAEWRHATVERMVTRQAKYWPEASLRSAFREDDIPGTFPAFEGISVDREGDRWVRLSNAGDTTSTLLDVFDRSGRYLGAVKVGRLLPAYGAAAWGRDDFYAALESEDGLPTIVRFHIERGRPRR
jgi:hypothetical protein